MHILQQNAINPPNESIDEEIVKDASSGSEHPSAKGWLARLRRPDTWWAVAAFLVVGLAYYKLGCPIKLITGLSCPGCGMTRALYYAATLRFGQAFACHPLFPLVPVLGVLLLSKRVRTHTRLRNALLIAVGAAFIVTYLLRLFVFHSPVVMPSRPDVLGLWQQLAGWAQQQ